MESYVHDNKVFIFIENNKQLQIGTIRGFRGKYIKLDPEFVVLLTLKVLMNNNIEKLSEDLFLDIIDSSIEVMKNRIYYRGNLKKVIKNLEELGFISQCNGNLIINSKLVGNMLDLVLRTKDGLYINKIFLNDNKFISTKQDINRIVRYTSKIVKNKIKVKDKTKFLNLISLVVRETKYGYIPTYSLIVLLFIEDRIEKQENWRPIFRDMVFELINKLFYPKSQEEEVIKKKLKKLTAIRKEYSKNVDKLCKLSNKEILYLCEHAKQKINPIVLESFTRYCMYILKYGKRMPTYNEMWGYLIEKIKKGNLPLLFKIKKPEQQIIYSH